MKNRKFKAWVEYTLITIAMMMFFVLVSIDDFEISAMPFIIMAWIVLAIIVLILDKYGKRRAFENDQRR